MSQLIETIRLLDGRFYNLSYHTLRMRKAWREIFNTDNSFDLNGVLTDKSFPKTGLLKCRVIYDTKLRGIAFEPYIAKKVISLKLVHDDGISYEHKFIDRTSLENLLLKKELCDDVLIIKNGFVTDTSCANVIFKKGNEWFTSESCLLPGTMRQQLIDRKLIRMERITIDQIRSFQKFKLINSMVLDEGPEIDVSNII